MSTREATLWCLILGWTTALSPIIRLTAAFCVFLKTIWTESALFYSTVHPSSPHFFSFFVSAWPGARLFCHVQEFSMQRFQSSCKLNFFSRWVWEYLRSKVSIKHHHLEKVKVVGAVAVAAIAVAYSARKVLSSLKNVSV